MTEASPQTKPAAADLVWYEFWIQLRGEPDESLLEMGVGDGRVQTFKLDGNGIKHGALKTLVGERRLQEMIQEAVHETS